MPMYEFNCTKCGIEFEEILGGNDPAPMCPACHSEKTERLMSAVSVRTGGRCGYDGGCDTGACGTGSCAPAASGCAGCPGGNCATCR